MATRGQRTAGNLRHRPQPTAKLPCCSRSSRTYFRCSDASRSRGVGKESANSPSSAPWEEKLDSVHEIAPQRALEPLELRRRGAEPSARQGGAGAGVRGVSLSPATRRGPAAAERSRHSPGALPPTGAPSPPASRGIPTPTPAAVTSVCRLEREQDPERSLQSSGRMPAWASAVSSSHSPALAKKAVGITPPKLCFAAAL